MKTPVAVLWSGVRKACDAHGAFRYFNRDDLKVLRALLPSGAEEKERRQLEAAINGTARLLWAEKVVEPLTAREAFASHLVTMTAAIANVAPDGKAYDTSLRRRRLASWFWCATLAGYPTRLGNLDRLTQDVDQLTAWLRSDGPVPSVVRNARAEQLFSAGSLLEQRSKNGRLFRAVQVQLYQRDVRDLRTGEPIEVGLHFGEHPQVDHIFATNWCRALEEPPSEGEVDSIVNKTVLSPYTNNRKRDRAPSEILTDLERQGLTPFQRGEILKGHLIDVDAVKEHDFVSFRDRRVNRMVDLLTAAVAAPA